MDISKCEQPGDLVLLPDFLLENAQYYDTLMNYGKHPKRRKQEAKLRNSRHTDYEENWYDSLMPLGGGVL
uniref:Uncharacterized protein n=1 Tax=Romanomermis culicivorax TaxID=13658 RepID=A0A915JKA5_ROMCU